MFLDHPLFGVGLDNFLYAYRGRYILDAAWQDPNLNHPHNVLIDFATRLGLFGLLAGALLFGSALRIALRLPLVVAPEWRPVAIGFVGALAYGLAHGLVDHSFFLVDLAYAFFLTLATVVWLASGAQKGEAHPTEA
jgi:O-antigen ligase